MQHAHILMSSKVQLTIPCSALLRTHTRSAGGPALNLNNMGTQRKVGLCWIELAEQVRAKIKICSPCVCVSHTLCLRDSHTFQCTVYSWGFVQSAANFTTDSAPASLYLSVSLVWLTASTEALSHDHHRRRSRRNLSRDAAATGA